MVNSDVRREAYEFLVLCAVILDVDFICVHIYDFTASFCHHLCPGVDADPLFKTGSHDRSLRLEKRNCLTHHVRSHQCTVSVIVLKERNEGCSHRSHLVRRNVHIVNLFFGDYREVSLETALDSVLFDGSVIIHLHIGKRNEFVFLFLCAHKLPAVIGKIYLSVLDLTVRGLDESQVINLRIDAKR